MATDAAAILGLSVILDTGLITLWFLYLSSLVENLWITDKENGLWVYNEDNSVCLSILFYFALFCFSILVGYITVVVSIFLVDTSIFVGFWLRNFLQQIAIHQEEHLVTRVNIDPRLSVSLCFRVSFTFAVLVLFFLIGWLLSITLPPVPPSLLISWVDCMPDNSTNNSTDNFTVTSTTNYGDSFYFLAGFIAACAVASCIQVVSAYTWNRHHMYCSAHKAKKEKVVLQNMQQNIPHKLYWSNAVKQCVIAVAVAPLMLTVCSIFASIEVNIFWNPSPICQKAPVLLILTQAPQFMLGYYVFVLQCNCIGGTSTIKTKTNDTNERVVVDTHNHSPIKYSCCDDRWSNSNNDHNANVHNILFIASITNCIVCVSTCALFFL